VATLKNFSSRLLLFSFDLTALGYFLHIGLVLNVCHCRGNISVCNDGNTDNSSSIIAAAAAAAGSEGCKQLVHMRHNC